MDCLQSHKGKFEKGKIGMINREISNVIAGDIQDKMKFINSDGISDLLNSLIASLKGCKIPINLTLFGPLRDWIYLKIFRSRIVKKATATNILIILMSGLIIRFKVN